MSQRQNVSLRFLLGVVFQHCYPKTDRLLDYCLELKTIITNKAKKVWAHWQSSLTAQFSFSLFTIRIWVGHPSVKYLI